MSAFDSSLSVLGIAKEATPGTAVAPTSFLRVTDLKPAAKPRYLPDTGMRGSMAKTYDEVLGPVSYEYEYDGNLYADEIAWALAGLLNDVAVTGSSDPYTSVFSLLNSGTGQPTTYTLTDWNGNVARAYAYSVFSGLNVKFTSDGLATFTAKVVSATAPIASTPTPSYSAARALAAWQVQSSVAGSTAPIITAGEVDIKRTVTPVFALANSQAPQLIHAAGDLEVTGSATFVYDAANGETIYTDFLNGTKVAVVFDLVNSASREVKFQMTQVLLDDVTIDRGTGKYVDLSVKYTATANSTDAGASAGLSPIKVTTKNALASGTVK